MKDYYKYTTEQDKQKGKLFCTACYSTFYAKGEPSILGAAAYVLLAIATVGISVIVISIYHRIKGIKCPICASTAYIPTSAPKAQKILQDLQSNYFN